MHRRVSGRSNTRRRSSRASRRRLATEEIGIATYGQLTTSSAIRVADYREPYRPIWCEEPVSPENMDDTARVAAHTSILIATGERLVM
jgi:L-alanine-DL-glutamate epimerase-like enolase superfamily enzyme